MNIVNVGILWPKQRIMGLLVRLWELVTERGRSLVGTTAPPRGVTRILMWKVVRTDKGYKHQFSRGHTYLELRSPEYFYRSLESIAIRMQAFIWIYLHSYNSSVHNLVILTIKPRYK